MKDFTIHPTDGYQIIPEYRHARLQLLVPVRIKKALKMSAVARGISINELVNRLIADFVYNEDE